MDALLKDNPNLVQLPRLGGLVEGVVLEKKGSKLFVDLGIRGMGIVFGREYYEAQDIIKGLKPGGTVSGKVVEVDNEEGYIELSLKEAGHEKKWQDLRSAIEEKKEFSLKVLEANRGGLILELYNIKGFMPVSQLSQSHYPRVEGGDKEKIFEELKKFVGQELKVRVIDVNQPQEKLIFSERYADTENIIKALSGYTIGDEIDGTISGVVDFGAFIRFGENLEGLVHISEIDWQLIDHPHNVLKPGDKVRAKIIDMQGDKISLSLKALKPNPWDTAAEKYKKGDTTRGTVVKFNPFGAFVKLDTEIQGLLHVSEFGSESKMRETLELNKQYDFKILSVEPKDHRLALGLIKEEKNAEPSEQKEEVTANPTIEVRPL
ncbi:MAG: S1 RNA-binding domain-containing protein [bacterium]|nr:S1 RNA-binding domain-containing protein [bacterium]